MKKRRISGTKAPESILGINAPKPPANRPHLDVERTLILDDA